MRNGPNIENDEKGKKKLVIGRILPSLKKITIKLIRLQKQMMSVVTTFVRVNCEPEDAATATLPFRTFSGAVMERLSSTSSILAISVVGGDFCSDSVVAMI